MCVRLYFCLLRTLKFNNKNNKNKNNISQKSSYVADEKKKVLIKFTNWIINEMTTK